MLVLKETALIDQYYAQQREPAKQAEQKPLIHLPRIILLEGFLLYSPPPELCSQVAASTSASTTAAAMDPLVDDYFQLFSFKFFITANVTTCYERRFKRNALLGRLYDPKVFYYFFYFLIWKAYLYYNKHILSLLTADEKEQHLTVKKSKKRLSLTVQQDENVKSTTILDQPEMSEGEKEEIILSQSELLQYQCPTPVSDVCFISSELAPEEQFAQAVDRVVTLSPSLSGVLSSWQDVPGWKMPSEASSTNVANPNPGSSRFLTRYEREYVLDGILSYMLAKQAELKKQEQAATVSTSTAAAAATSADSHQYTHTHLPANLQPAFPFAVILSPENQPTYTWQGVPFDEMPDMKLLSLHCLSARRKS